MTGYYQKANLYRDLRLCYFQLRYGSFPMMITNRCPQTNFFRSPLGSNIKEGDETAIGEETAIGGEAASSSSAVWPKMASDVNGLRVQLQAARQHIMDLASEVRDCCDKIATLEEERDIEENNRQGFQKGLEEECTMKFESKLKAKDRLLKKCKDAQRDWT